MEHALIYLLTLEGLKYHRGGGAMISFIDSSFIIFPILEYA